MTQTIRDRGYSYFLSEAPELLETVERRLLNLHEGNRMQNIHELMRATHTLKGAAANVGLDTIKTISHSLEDVFRALCNEQAEISTEVERLLFEAYDCLRLPLTAELSGTSIDSASILDRAEAIFDSLKDHLGDFADNDYIPSSAELGFDIARSIFEMGVQERIEALDAALQNPPSPDAIADLLKAQAEVFIGLGESLNLPGWGNISKTVLAALEMYPQEAVEIARIALDDFKAGQKSVLDGDRTSGGQPSESLAQFASASPQDDAAIDDSETAIAELADEFARFIDSPAYSQKGLKPEIRDFFIATVRYIFEWFRYAEGVLPDELTFNLLVPEANFDGIDDREFLEAIVSEATDEISSWMARFLAFIGDETEPENLQVYRQWTLLCAVLAVAKFQYRDRLQDGQKTRAIALINALRKQIDRASKAYKQLSPLSRDEKNWIDRVPPLPLPTTTPPLEDELDPDLIEEIWGQESEIGDIEAETEGVDISIPEYEEESEDNVPPIEEIEASEDPPSIPEVLAPETAETPTEEPAKPTRAASEVRQLASVDLKGLARLNHRVGELSIAQNRQVLEDEKLRRSSRDLRGQLQQHQTTLNQLVEWSEQIMSLVDRVPELARLDRLLQLGNSDFDLEDFYAPNLESYADLHTLLRSAIAEIQKLDDRTSEIDSLVKGSSYVMEKQQKILSVMQDDLIEVRMLPIGEVLERFPGMVKNLSRVQDKAVNLKLSGTEVLVEQGIAQKLYDPLLHLVRNAFDHGIESPEVRRQLGKPEAGTIEIRAYNRGTQTWVEVSDDGKGLDMNWIRQRAVEGQFLSHSEADRLVEPDLLEVIFEPGFSTASRVSEISGRGIGLDVVRDRVRSLKGTVKVQSQPQRGTTFTLQIPLGISIAKLLVVQGGGHTYALLLDSVEKILLPQADRIKLFEDRRALHWHTGEEEVMVPVRQLADLMHYSFSSTQQVLEPTTNAMSIPRKQFAPILILNSGSRRLGLEVDQIIGEQELVIRPLGSAIEPPSYIYGCSILSDGRLTLAIDGGAMLDRAFAPRSKAISSTKPRQTVAEIIPPDPLALPDTPATKTDDRTTVLVIDDSLNLRQTLRDTLEDAGYRVIEARDGSEGLEKLDRNPEIEVIFCDIEMPRTNGFEFLGQRRQNPQFAEVPTVMLTSHSSDRYRQLAMELGASAYLTKPYSESQVLSTLTEVLNETASG